MSTRELAEINPEMLVWARTSAKLDLVDVAVAEKLDPARLQSWEDGEAKPTYAQLERLAKRYRRPTMVFYMDARPAGFPIVADYRTLTNPTQERSTNSTFIVREAQDKQEWASDHLRYQGAKKIALVGQFQLSDRPEDVAAVLRNVLRISIKLQSEWPSDSAFSFWRGKIEAAGILVFSFSGVEVGEMRGFALPDAYAPLVAVNSADSDGAKCYSILHEVAHLLIGESGISNSPDGKKPKHRIERFCEEVAAAALMPADDFRKRVPAKLVDVDEVVAKLAKFYRASRLATVYRLADVDAISKAEADRLAHKYRSTPRKKPASSAIPQTTLAISRNGKAFTRLVVSAYRFGAIHGGELTSLIGLALRFLPKLDKALGSQRFQPGEGNP